MVLMKNRTKHEAYAIAQSISKEATEFFGWPHVLEVEKMSPDANEPGGFLLIGKKRYCFLKYETPDSVPYLSSSGLENVRRDNAILTSKTMQTCLELMVKDGKPQKAIDYVHGQLRLLLTGKIDMSQLIISKGLSKTEKHYEESTSRQTHAELAKRIKKRSAVTGETIPHTGDRVKFVITDGHKNAKTYELAEDPLYVMQNDIPINTTYYIEKQMLKPLIKIFTPLLAPNECTFKYNTKGERKDKTLKEYKALTAYKTLFTGPHMRILNKKTAVVGGMAGFIQKTSRCISCKAPSKKPVCMTCTQNGLAPAIYMEEMAKQRDLEKKYNEYWTQCQRCTGTMIKSVECGNQDCGNFFRREAVKKDLKKQCEKVAWFDDW